MPGLFRFCRNLNLFAVDAKFLVEKALAFQELADHGLSGGQVAILTGKQGQNKPATWYTCIITNSNCNTKWTKCEVNDFQSLWFYHFYPRSSHWNKLTFLDIVLNLGEETWIPALHPVKLLGLKQGTGKKKLRKDIKILRVKISFFSPLTREFTWEQTKRKSGFFSIKRTTVTQLLPHLRMVSSYGHSQAADTQVIVDSFDRNWNITRVCPLFFGLYPGGNVEYDILHLS